VHFLYESELSSFFLITFGFVIFGAKILYEEGARKMLMELTPVPPYLRIVRTSYL